MPSPPAEKKILLKLAKNIFRSALFHTQTRASLKYPVTDAWPRPPRIFLAADIKGLRNSTRSV